MHQFRLVFHKGQHPTYIVGDAKRQQSDDKDQEQHPPEAQILYKLLPRGAEAGQDPLPLLQVGIEEGMAFHGAVREAKGKKGHETTHHPFQKQKTKETALFKKTNLKIYIDEKKTDIYILTHLCTDLNTHLCTDLNICKYLDNLP